MLGLTALELGRLRMSVGYGTQKKGRPLSPVEVGKLFHRALDAGSSLKDCANQSQLKGTSQVTRFLRVLDLPEDIQHLVGWGSEKGAIGFSAAFELARLERVCDQRIVAESVLEDRLQSKEIRQIAQLRERSKHPIEDCLKEVLSMRTIIERRYVFMGSITDQNVIKKLADLTQEQRNAILKIAIGELGLHGTTGRLGQRIFTLVGGERFNKSMNGIGKEKMEAKIFARIETAI